MTSWFYHFLQTVRLRWLIAGAFALTGVFSLGYGELDHLSAQNGLRPSSGMEAPQWFDYIYFSVVTETTLGYGDFTPLGLSRALACLQVFCGVIFAGVVIARLTSVAINRLTEIENAVRGIWVDVLHLPNVEPWLGIVEFIADDGTILFRGVNYSSDGKPQHSFSCRLLYHDWPHCLVFRYEEAHDHSSLQHGQTTVTFSDWRRKKPQCFQITIDDKATHFRISTPGSRITEKKWLRQLRKPTRSAATIQEIYQNFASQLPKSTSDTH